MAKRKGTGNFKPERKTKKPEEEEGHTVNQTNHLWIPKKGSLAEMEEHCPGAIDRFLGMTEQQQLIDKEIDLRALENESKEMTTNRIWVVQNGIIWLVVILIGGLLLWYNKAPEAIGSAAFSSVISGSEKRVDLASFQFIHPQPGYT